MNKVKNQHYVPQFYLKNFSTNQKQLFVFDKVNNKEFPSAIDSVASSRFFYDWKELDEIVGKQFIESSFSEFEGEASIALNDLISRIKANNFKGFGKEEKHLIAEFIWYQMIRTSEARTQGDHTAKVLEESLRSKGFTEEEIKNSGLSYADSDARLDHLRMIVDPIHVKESVKSLLERIWIITVNKTSYRFYTSDNPIVRHTHYDIGFSAYELFYPLTPYIGLMILNSQDFSSFLPLNHKIMPLKDKEHVKWYNEKQVFLSGRQVFNIENDFRLAKKMIKNNPELRNPERPRIRQLL